MRFRFFFFNDTATTEIYTLSLHDALPISRRRGLSAHFHARGGHRDEMARRLDQCERSEKRDAVGWRQIRRAHVWTPVTQRTRIPSSALKKNALKVAIFRSLISASHPPSLL